LKKVNILFKMEICFRLTETETGRYIITEIVSLEATISELVFGKMVDADEAIEYLEKVKNTIEEEIKRIKEIKKEREKWR